MSPPTRPRLNGLIQDAVRKASKFSIVSMKDSIERLGLSTLINSSTDEAIERFHLLGELTLQRCFVNHICQRAPRHRKAGYYSVMRFAILCQETQALIMSHSDMQTLGGSSAVLADALAILLGAMSEAVDFPAVSAWYERAFGPVTNAADEAYVSYWSLGSDLQEDMPDADMIESRYKRAKLVGGDHRRFSKALCILECSDKLTPVVPPPQISVNKVVRGPIPDGSLLLAPKVPGSLLASVISILGSELHRGSKRKTLHLDAPPPSPPSPPQQFSPLRAREKAKSTYVRETRAPAPPSPHRRHANTTIPYQQRRSPTASRSIVSETPVPVISKSPQPVYDARANFMLPFGLRSWLPPSPTDPTMLRLATLYEDGPAESTSAIHIKSSRPPLVPRRPILLPQFSSNPAIYNTRFSPGF